ncbi:MAG: hypothetical protein ACLUFH_00545 [Monoglobales bacterium]
MLMCMILLCLIIIFFARNSVRVTRAEGEFNAGVISAIISSQLDIVGDGISKILDFMVSKADNPECAYMICDESVYEVYFKADGVYYTHCYHENVIAYNNSGSVLSNGSYNLTYQRAGG